MPGAVLVPLPETRSRWLFLIPQVLAEGPALAEAFPDHLVSSFLSFSSPALYFLRSPYHSVALPCLIVRFYPCGPPCQSLLEFRLLKTWALCIFASVYIAAWHMASPREIFAG